MITNTAENPTILLKILSTKVVRRYLGLHPSLEIAGLTPNTVHYRIGKNRYRMTAYCNPIFRIKIIRALQGVSIPLIILPLTYISPVLPFFLIPLLTDTFDSNKDSYIRDTASSENNGTATVIDVRWRSGLWIYRGLVQADLSSIAGATINSATFVINVTLFSEWTTANIDLERITSSWTETGVTWGNQPTTTATNKASREFTSSHTGTQSWTMTALMQDLVDNTNNGIMIKRATAGSGSNNEAMQCTSREGAVAPYFSVDYEPAAATFTPKVSIF